MAAHPRQRNPEDQMQTVVTLAGPLEARCESASGGLWPRTSASATVTCSARSSSSTTRRCWRGVVDENLKCLAYQTSHDVPTVG